MACQFSPWNQGLSNLPRTLPQGSLVILNDQSPICGHDSSRILRQLKELLEGNRCYGLLLDFERPGQEEAAAMAAALAEALPCPVGVSAAYADGLSTPVFLPPAPPDTPLGEYLAPWAGREIWLEAALNGCRITLTERGGRNRASGCRGLSHGGLPGRSASLQLPHRPDGFRSPVHPLAHPGRPLGPSGRGGSPGRHRHHRIVSGAWVFLGCREATEGVSFIITEPPTASRRECIHAFRRTHPDAERINPFPTALRTASLPPGLCYNRTAQRLS